MTSIPESSELTEEEKGTVGLGNPPVLADTSETVLSGRGLIKTFGRVVGLDGVDVDLFPGEILSVIARDIQVDALATRNHHAEFSLTPPRSCWDGAARHAAWTGVVAR